MRFESLPGSRHSGKSGISWLSFGSIPSVLLLGFIQVPDFFCLQLTWPRSYIACINRHFRC